MSKLEIFFPGGKRVDAEYRGFTIQTDQSIGNGGEGSAPAPFDLFLTSIGTCVGFYVLSFCQHRHIPTENMRIIQTMDKNAKTGMLDKIRLEIKLPSDFPDKYRNALVHSAQLCAVKKHMQQPPEFSITTTLEPD